MIWLIDATYYPKTLDEELLKLKKDYFRIKHYVATRKLGNHIYPRERSFSVGLLRVASILRFNEIDVEYIHFEDLLSRLNGLNDGLPDVIAFSAVCPTVPMCSELSFKIRQLLPGIRIVIAGPQINVGREVTKLKYTNFDDYISGFDIQAVNSLLPSFCRVLTLPKEYLDYKLLPYALSDYMINTFTTLGCCYSCDYCQDKFIPYFERCLDGDIGKLNSLLPAKTRVHFFDSTLGYKPTRMMQVCNCIAAIKHDLILSCELRAEQINIDSIRALTKAGFGEIRIGVESADSMVLDHVQRRHSIDDLTKKLKLVHDESDLYISTYILSGLIGSTNSSNAITNDFLVDLIEGGYVDEVKNGIYVPYPMDNCDYSKKDISITCEDWSCYDRQSYPVFHLSEQSEEDIWQDFLLNTRIIVNSWMKANGFSCIEQLPSTTYPEYNQRYYLSNNS